MKKILLSIFLLIFLPVCLADMEYALQGDVRVYVENDLCGLEDAEGNKLCEAKYDYIKMIDGDVYAIIYKDGIEAKINQIEIIDGYACAIIHKDGKKGVIGVDGVEIVEPVWDIAAIGDESGTIMCTNLPEGPAQVINMSPISEEPETDADISQLEYALQGDVRVYVENGLAGLEDAQGNPICEAKYTYIDPFLDRDYAAFHVADEEDSELCGIISREGQEIVPAKWEIIEFTADGLTAMGYEYDSVDNRTRRHVYDLATGEVLYEEAKNEHVSIEGNRINIYSHHNKGYYRPPFHTDIYDSRMNLIFSADARLVDFGGYYHAQYGDESLGVVDMDGNVILSGVKSLVFHDDGTISYHWEQYRHRNVFEACVDIVGNALDRALWKNGGNYRDRNCVEWGLYRFGIVTQPREVIPISGILFEDGTVFEYSGDLYRDSMEDYSGSIKHGGEGLYLVHVGGGEYLDGWIYVDETGKQAVPGRYDRAYTFIDGSAVVYDYNDGYRLIDKDGKMVGDTSWQQSWINDDVFDQTVIPVCDSYNGFHYRLMDRGGNFISDTLYRSVDWDYHGWFCATNVRGKSTFLREDGSFAINGIWDGHYIGENDGAPGPWVEIDGLVYQIDEKTGKPTHEQGYSEVFYDSACLPDGKTWVVIDEMGNPVGPYYGQSGVPWPDMTGESGK